MNETAKTEMEELLSIGDVAEATALSVDTIRVWERRYGRPQPVRLPSGHRRYRESDVRWLRRIAEALARGHRPSKVIPLEEERLNELLGDPASAEKTDDEMAAYLKLILAYAEVELRDELQAGIERVGPRAFVTDTVSPLVQTVGRLWADGELEIRHEHFTSEILEDLLRQLRESMPEAATKPVVLLATLPGEVHSLGLQMAAVVTALAEARPSMLGTDVPLNEIVAAVRDTGADAVCVSVSLATAGVGTDRVLAELRALLPDEIPLVVGGRGARGVRRGPRGITWIADLNEYERWLRESL
jgi:methanogenic corrinoid protein MtbC1